MNPKKMIGLSLGVALLLPGTALAAAAQTPGTTQSPYGTSASDTLNRNLRLIADQPRNVSALLGAGNAALDLGDPQAALTFFARAEEIAPNDGRAKAGMGAVFVQMEKASEALNFFREATSLGVPEAEFAGDRGLAFDLTGDPRRAQADYALSLRRQEDPEVRRRLALSLAISGERAKALATIDNQLRTQDRAAWRVRSFILALTGDAAEATRYAEAVMPAQAAQMRPFFAALPGLRPADRAAAVHFGHFPEGPAALQTALAQAKYASAAPVQAAPQPTLQQTSPGRRSKSSEKNSRRRPATEQRQADATRESAASTLAERYGWTGRGVTPRRQEQAKPTIVADAGPTQRQSPAITQQARPQSQPATPPVQQPQQPSPAAQAQVAVPSVQAAGTAPFGSSQVASNAPSFDLRTSPIIQTQAPQPAPTAPAQVTPAPLQAPTATAQAQIVAPTVQAPVTTPSTSHGLASVAPGSSVASPQVAPAQPQPSVQTAEIPASTLQSQVAPPSEVASTPRPSGLAGLAATIQSLPTESPAAPNEEPKPQAPAQLALNTTAKPTYGPKFENSKPEASGYGPKFETPKAAAAEKKKEEPTKKEVAKKEDTKAATSKNGASKKEEETKSASAKKETAGKTAGAKKEEDPKSASAKKEMAGKTATAKKEEPKEASRHWVQIAGGANDAAMNREFLRLKDKAPKLLASRSAWTTPLKATNRLLVGPFKSADEAQDFVNELSKAGVSAFSWTSPAGQEIVKLASK